MSVRFSTLMDFPENKPLRSLGVYKLRDATLILFKRSAYLSFLFTPENWNRQGPVDYRVSYGRIYRHGRKTALFDRDLIDTGVTAGPPNLFLLFKNKPH